MSAVDVLLLSFIGGFVFGGFRTGFVRRLAGLGFLVAAFVAASYLRAPVIGLLEVVARGMHEDHRGLVAFGAVFAGLLVGLHLVSRPFLSRVAVGGLSKAADRALGAGLGLLEGVVLASIGIVIVTTYASDELLGGFTAIGLLPDIARALEGSRIAQALMSTTVPFVVNILGPLLPPDIKSAIGLLPLR